MSTARRPTPAVALVGLLTLGCAKEPASDGVPFPNLVHVEPDVVRAIQQDHAALLAAPESPEAWGRLGTRYLAHEFMDEAAACFARAEELEPGKGTWPYRLGWSLFDDHPAEALAPFQRSLGELDGYAPAHEALGRLYLRLGRTDEAQRHFTTASELDPRSAHAESGLGQIELSRTNYEAARMHYAEALARDETHVEAHIGIAQAYLALGQPEQAARHAERSRSLPPTTPRNDWMINIDVTPAGAKARTRYGIQLQRQGRAEQAEEQFRAALESEPHYYAARKRLAGILTDRGQRGDALLLLREGLELHPESLEIRQDIAALEQP